MDAGKGGEGITLQQAFIAFEEALTARPVSAEAQGMYLRLLYYANQGRYKTASGAWVFPKWVQVRREELIVSMGWKDKRTLQKVRDELVSAGYVRFKSGNGAGVTEYLLVQLLTSEERKQIEEEIEQPLPAPVKERQGSFDLDEFFALAVRRSLGEDA